MATRTPDVVMDDTKISKLLNDLLSDCLKISTEAAKIRKTQTFKALGSEVKSRFSKFEDAILISADNAEVERDRCLDGKASDLKKMKTLLSKQLVARDDMKELNGRIRILEAASVDTKLASVLALIVIVKGSTGDLIMLQRRFDKVYKQLNKAQLACKDKSLKTVLTLGMGGIKMCLGPIGAAITIVQGVTTPTGKVEVGGMVDATEDAGFNKARKSLKVAAATGKAIKGTPKAFGPVVILTTAAVNLVDAGFSIAEARALKKEINALLVEIKRIAPAVSTQLLKLDAMTDSTDKALKSAIGSVRSYRAGAAGYHKLPNMLK